jgi:uncharacterized membrane protein HdeD (DUF308 family)
MNMSKTVKDVGRLVSKPSILLSILLIVLGLLAIALPLATSLGVAIVVGWLILFGGLVQVAHTFQSKGIGHVLWKLLVAVFYLFAGVYLISNPALGMLGLTLALAIFFFAEGVTDLISYLSTRREGGSGWMLFDGVITLGLGIVIWSAWPFSSFWVLGTVAGISILMTGITRLMMALAVRKLTRDESARPIQQDRAA